MENTSEYRQNQINEIKKSVMPLLKYLPWIKKHSGVSASHNYKTDEMEGSTISFPVYDPTLMEFVKLAEKSDLMDKNYRYVYTRNRIKTYEDERNAIKKADINSFGVLRGILSKYIIDGHAKGILWSEAVKEDIFYLILKQMKSIIEFWDEPIVLDEEDVTFDAKEDAWKKAAEIVLAKKAAEEEKKKAEVEAAAIAKRAKELGIDIEEVRELGIDVSGITKEAFYTSQEK